MPEILNEINWLDILFVILLLGMVYKGLRVGVGGQILSLAGGFVLLYVALEYYSFLSEAIFGFLFQKWTKSITFFIITGGFFVAIKILERLVSAIGSEEFAPIERLGGTVIAAFRAFMLAGIIGMLLLLIPIDSVRMSVTDGSKTCMFFINLDLHLYNWMKGIVNSTDEKKDMDQLVEELMDSSEDSND